jgi:tetratricopeptide (TPR) repeat protein
MASMTAATIPLSPLRTPASPSRLSVGGSGESSQQKHQNHRQQQQQQTGVIEHFDSEVEYLPTESQLVLLCLDHLRDLRRAYGSNPQDLLDAEGLHADWLTLAIYALGRSFSSQGGVAAASTAAAAVGGGRTAAKNQQQHVTMPVFNDAWMDSRRIVGESSRSRREEMMNPPSTPGDLSQLPSIEEMTKSVLYVENPCGDDDDEDHQGNRGNNNSDEDTIEDRNDGTDDKNNNNGVIVKKRSKKTTTKGKDGRDDNHNFAESYAWYEYDDHHPSNSNRFFLLNGLSSSVHGRGPLLLGEVAAAGLCQLQAKSRRHAEEDLAHSPLFEQFVNAVKSKGFFQDPEHDTPTDDPKEEEKRLIMRKAVYDERMRKVIGKFRDKLAAKLDLHEASGGADALTAALVDFHYNRRMQHVVLSRRLRKSGLMMSGTSATPVPPLSLTRQLMMSSSSQQQYDGATIERSPPAAQKSAPEGAEIQSQEDAERLKSQGNAHMQKKEYEAASERYTQALRISPSGPQSHVYFSNRAAALLSMKKFDLAILDSERALALKPTYGKAHARLGLAHFLLGDYRQAMEAYTVALKYEPDNKSSRSYLEKAAKKLAAITTTAEVDTDLEGNFISTGGGGTTGGITNNSTGPTSFSLVSEWDKSNAQNTIGKAASAEAPMTRNEGGGRHIRKTSGGGHLPALPQPSVALETAEKHKNQGNSFMANREYQQAYESYSIALEFSPNGPQSHVYYSNRAAALCYLERYEEASQDSEKAVSLKPTYGKAHARLGLSRFFLKDYESAVVAYTASLQYDPDNAASKSYLAKAKLKWERQQHEASSINVTAEARRLMEDPDMMLMAKKVLNASNTHDNTSTRDLMDDPEMRSISMRAMADPTMKEALLHIHQVDKSALSPTSAALAAAGSDSASRSFTKNNKRNNKTGEI